MSSRRAATPAPVEPAFALDDVSEWSERKIRIVKKYARPYAQILHKYRMRPFYIDGFCGGGAHRQRGTGLLIPGTAAEVLASEPPFCGYHLVDLDGEKCAAIRELGKKRAGVVVHAGDANDLLPPIFATIRFDERERALCFIDPYKLIVAWKLILAAGQNRAIEGFILFPSNDIQRNLLRSDRSTVPLASKEAMTRFWGDDSWEATAYSRSPGLFEEMEQTADVNRLAEAFAQRLKSVAGFTHVSPPLAMMNSKNGIMYHLLFASHHALALKIAKDVLNSEARRGRGRYRE